MNIIMLIGLPGSGKSTWAKEYANHQGARYHILSSDAIRKELYGKEEIQGIPKEVFGLLYKKAEEFCEKGENIIIDATNLSSNKRKAFIKRFKHFNPFLQAVVFHTPVETCIERDKERSRHVGEGIIIKMSKSWCPVKSCEGWNSVIEYYG